MRSLSMLLSACLLAMQVSAAPSALNKIPLESGLTYLDQPFWNNLKPTGLSSLDIWSAGWAPQACVDQAKSSGRCAANNMEVYDVYYNDCSLAWVMCRCKDADMSISQMIDVFGRMPVAYRQWVRHPIAFHDTNRYAYSVNGEVVVFKDSYVPTLWIHETSHHIDSGLTAVNGNPYSTTSTWNNAINADAYVPDPYSNTSPTEDYAQVANIVLFNANVPGGFATVEPNPQRVANQVNTLTGAIGSAAKVGGSCTRRWADTQPVQVGSSFAPSTKPPFMVPKNDTGLPMPAIDKAAPTLKKTPAYAP